MDLKVSPNLQLAFYQSARTDVVESISANVEPRAANKHLIASSRNAETTMVSAGVLLYTSMTREQGRASHSEATATYRKRRQRSMDWRIEVDVLGHVGLRQKSLLH